MLEMGLNLENCERWLERAVFVFVAVMVVIIIIRVRRIPALSYDVSSDLKIHSFISYWQCLTSTLTSLVPKT